MPRDHNTIKFENALMQLIEREKTVHPLTMAKVMAATIEAIIAEGPLSPMEKRQLANLIAKRISQAAVTR